jgi:uncharacterized protein (UPF0332 family)
VTGPDAVAARVRRATRHLGTARRLIADGLPDGAAHALYFAAFHLVQGLLATAGIAPETHRGTQQMFSLHFVRPGLVPEDFGLRFNQLLGQRGLADYGLGDDVTMASVREARDSLCQMAPVLLALLRERAGEADLPLAEAEAAAAALAAA